MSYADFVNQALDWIAMSQDRVSSGGVGCFEFQGWTPGYPEVTGYIIPTVWDCATTFVRPDLAARAMRMSEWELAVQSECGGVEGLYEGYGQPPVVFNTGQVLRGLLRSWQETGDDRYLIAARRAGDWIVSVQDPDGGWGASNFEGLKRVYDTYVSAPLAALSLATGAETYARAAERNCEFALAHQRPNGWFDLCDNTSWGNAAPLTHTLCYAVDGLLETGTLLHRDDLIEAATTSAARMAAAVDESGYFPGRFDSRWKPTVSWVCVTGAAQLGAILMKLSASEEDHRYRETAVRLADFLTYVQKLNGVGRSRTGGLPGSYPIWEYYGRLKYPSWAAKYFIDFLLAMHTADEEAMQQ